MACAEENKRKLLGAKKAWGASHVFDNNLIKTSYFPSCELNDAVMVESKDSLERGKEKNIMLNKGEKYENLTFLEIWLRRKMGEMYEFN